MKSLLKTIVRTGLHDLGGLNAVMQLKRNQFRILTYHRFSPAVCPNVSADLHRQCEFLRKNFEILPMAEIGRSIDTGQKLPPNALAITVDDGYRDFYTDAFPVFRHWNIPATVFLITDFLDGTYWPWWNKVEYAVQHSPLTSCKPGLGPAFPAELPLRDATQKAQAVAALQAALVQVSHQTLLDFVQRLPGLLDVDLPAQAPALYQPMSWDEARAMRASGMEFGAHTKTHPLLTNLENPEQVYDEISHSKARVDAELGTPTLHFCYPNGNFDETAVSAVGRCGFQTGVTTRTGLNTMAAPRYELQRISVGFDAPDTYFREQVAGLHA